MEESKISLISLLKEKYDYENERKRYFDNVLNFPITLITFLVGGIYLIISDPTGTFLKNCLYKVIIFILLITLIITFYFIFRVYFGNNRRYCSFPDSDAIYNRFEELQSYYSNKTEVENIDSAVADNLNEDIIKWYLATNKNNTSVNDLRADSLHNSKIFIGLSIFLGFLLLILFCLSKFF